MNFYGQAGQDRFAWAVVGGEHGTFLDIGAGDGVTGNNSYAMEQAGWTGLLVDREPTLPPILAASRRSRFVCADAKTIDWGCLAPFGPVVDYLSFDVDDDGAEALAHLPLATVRFRAMTIEHDAYRLGGAPRQRMRDLLHHHGYRLLCPDVSVEGHVFEDWWIDSERVDLQVAARLETTATRDGLDIMKEIFP